MSTGPAHDHQGQRAGFGPIRTNRPDIRPQPFTAQSELQELACHTGGVHI